MIASYLHHYLRELRSGVRLVRDSNAAWADYLLDVRKGDVVVVFDFRRYQRDVLEFARGAAAQGAEVILVTDIWYSPIAAIADFVVACPVSIPSAFDSGVTGLADGRDHHRRRGRDAWATTPRIGSPSSKVCANPSTSDPDAGSKPCLIGDQACSASR